MQKKKKSDKKRKNCGNLLKETRARNNKLTGNIENCKQKEKKLNKLQIKNRNPIFLVSAFNFAGKLVLEKQPL